MTMDPVTSEFLEYDMRRTGVFSCARAKYCSMILV